MAADDRAGGPGAVDAVLRSVPLLAALDDASRSRLADGVDTVHLAGGEVLLRQGDEARDLYVVRSGRLRVTVLRPDGTEELLGHVGRGEPVGEMALISDEPRSATVVADRDAELVRIPIDAFDALVASDPSLLRAIASEVVARMRRSLQDPGPDAPCSTITVLALDPEGPQVDVAAGLVARLVGDEPGALAVDRGRARRALGPEGVPVGGTVDPSAARWVGDLEQAHPLLVLEADPTDPGWTAWCVRQSDLVLVVADGRTDPDLRALEEGLAARRRAVGAAVELVLVRPSWAEDAHDTSAWLARRPVDRHHHVRADHPEDLARVARLVRGRGVVLVLSGGGARGMAHIGVVRALEELDVPVDAVGGTSIGALVGAAVARGWGWRRIRRAMRAGVAEGRSIVDPTLPLLSLAAGRRVTRRLRDAGDGLDLEDLHLDYFCVSTNLSRREAREHDRGPGWRAIRASLAIPGLFPPVPDGGDVLVDGGLLENHPVARMRRRWPGSTVVGVDVGSHRDLPALGLPDTCELSTWGLLRSTIGRRGADAQAVSLARILTRLTELGLQEGDGDGRADVTVEPDVRDVPILGFDRFDGLVERGHEEACRVLAPWAATRAASAGPGGSAVGLPA